MKNDFVKIEDLLLTIGFEFPNLREPEEYKQDDGTTDAVERYVNSIDIDGYWYGHVGVYCKIDTEEIIEVYGVKYFDDDDEPNETILFNGIKTYDELIKEMMKVPPYRKIMEAVPFYKKEIEVIERLSKLKKIKWKN
jgi:hypothetical protein